MLVAFDVELHEVEYVYIFSQHSFRAFKAYVATVLNLDTRSKILKIYKFYPKSSHLKLALKVSSLFTQKDIVENEIIVFQNWQITNCVYRAVWLEVYKVL